MGEARLVRALADGALRDEVMSRFGGFLRDRIDPGTRGRDRAGEPFARELLVEAGALGLFGFTVPTSVGGAGRTWGEWGLVLHEIAYACADTSFPMLLAYCGT